MARLAAGHDAALNTLMERHAEKLFQYLVRSLQNEEDASDLAQETLVRVYENRKSFDPGQKFATWLYAIASNLVRDRYRWRQRHPQVSLDAPNEAAGEGFGEAFPAPGGTPVENAQAGERADQVRRAVASLPEELRTPLILAERGKNPRGNRPHPRLLRQGGGDAHPPRPPAIARQSRSFV